MKTLLPFLLSAALLPALLHAASETGVVRAADQLIPGAEVTASQGTAKVVAYTNENGSYSMNLPAGEWDIQVQAFGFTIAKDHITVGNEPGFKNWTLEMPRPGQKPGETPTVTSQSAPANPGRGRGRGRGRGDNSAQSGGPGRGGAGAGQGNGAQAAGSQGSAQGAPQRPAFQSAQANATQPNGAQAAQDQSLDAGGAFGGLDADSADADQAFLVNGSTSGGLAASADQNNRQFNGVGRGGQNGQGGALANLGGLGLPAGMVAPGSDGLGLGGFGAQAIDGGFGGGPGGPGGPGGFGGPGGGPGGGGPGGGGGGGGGGRGGGGGGRGGGGGGRGQNRQARGPFNGNFNSFGNRRRNQAAYTGSVFVQLADSALNAAPFSVNGEKEAKPSSNNLRFGGNIGGPLVIPKILNWKRASFYFTYQGTVSRNPFNQVSTMPSGLEREGNFSQTTTTVGGVVTPVQIFNPTSGGCNAVPAGAAFPGNIIPASCINPQAQALLNSYFPLPTSGLSVQNYNFTGATPNDNNNVGMRFNMPLDNKDRLNFNIQEQTRSSQTLQLFGFRDHGSGTGLSAQAGWSHSFAPRFNSNASVTFSHNTNQSTPFFANTTNVEGALGILGTTDVPLTYGPPNLSFANFGGLSDSSASLSRNQTFTATEALTYSYKRKHNLTFGFTYNRLQQNSLSYANARGSYSFSGLETSQILNGQPVSGTGYDFADFLLGLPQTASLGCTPNNSYDSNVCNNYFRSWSTSAYANDDYRIARNLTLNFGLRYEYFAPYTELYGHIANLILPENFVGDATVVTPATAASYGLPSSLVRSNPRDFSPRFGFAWRPSPKHSVQIRGGYSIFYSGSPYQTFVSSMASQPPFTEKISLATSSAYQLTIQDGFLEPPPAVSGLSNTYAINPDQKIPYAQTWVFAIQNTFPHGFLVETEYLGTKGTHLSVYENPNQAPPGTSVLNAQEYLSIPNSTGFNYQTYGANSIFNAGQLRITRRFQRGMGFVLLYTYSKSIDNASALSGSGGTAAQFTHDWHLERGLSSSDQRHKLSYTYTLSSPVGVNGMLRNGGWKTAVLAGWTLNGTLTAATGTPLTARLGGNLANTAGSSVAGSPRAQATGVSIDGGDNPFFNTAAFTTPEAGQYGNAGVDTIPGPFQVSLNAALNRAWRIGESRRQFQLRISATNPLNYVYISGFGTTVNTNTYGVPTTGSATRTATLFMRFNF
ncbi:MAG TPA: TonB-dependent receptor [Bryobacteraceae bacterium]